MPSRHYASSLEVKMTPMIDVVFLLLIFFVWTSSFETPEFDLPSALAETPVGGSSSVAEPPRAEAFDEIVVKLMLRNRSTVIEFGGQRLDSFESLRSRLAEVISLGVQPPVIIDPEPDVSMETAVRAYDAARSAGADRVLYATVGG